MGHEEQAGRGEGAPPSGVNPEAIRVGHEGLQTNVSALRLAALIFVLTAIVLHVDLYVLETYYVAQPRPEDAATSIAHQTAPMPGVALEPRPDHNQIDWQDMAQLRQRENAGFEQLGWSIDPATGQPVIPDSAIAAAASRYGQSGGPRPQALQFPPTLSPVRVGPGVTLTRANVFPPVGAAAEAEQLHESIWRPPPGPRDAKDLPTEKGPAGRGDLVTPSDAER